MGATAVYAAENTKIDVYFKNLRYMFDGVEKKPSGSKGFIYDGTTYVPLRFIGEALGKEVSWQSETETVWIGQQPKQESLATKDSNGTSLTDLSVSKQDEASSLAINSWNAGGYNTAKSKTFTINGKSYTTGLGLYLHNNPYPPYYRIGGTATFNISGKYTRLTGLVGAAESTLSGTAEGTLKIIGDGKELLVISGIFADQAPKQVDVDLTGVQELKINFNSNRKSLINMIFADPQLTAAKTTVTTNLPATAPSDVSIVTRNRTAEYVAIKNTSQKTIDLKGWRVLSTNGQEAYTFKDNITLGPDSYIFLTSGSDGAIGRTSDFREYARSFVWSTNEIWSDQSEDTAQLYDAAGKLISEYK
ncbi:lamin tail domain-containing protein [Paenibacillus roseipurpureus]|uniref:Lamin tail domain-containing protein n=1 Tax=Paenibacillus roseopurpureus TaxID=2918901 RepID=A0AA96LTI9_9BACL|nr:lamin tail domain-containing protein [Paenibacillus sp. MBLB1832]WNR45789.1 lamin tail domain-containing protein [Paenibacillus sp. MBLB1832]